MRKFRVDPAVRGLVAALAACAQFLPAHADHVSIVVDGDLADLIDAVSGNPAAGCSLPNSAGNIYTQNCAFANGYDLTNGYIFLDVASPDGGIADTYDLYAGFQVTGVIGDYDGDGNANVYSNQQGGCTSLGNETGTNRDGRTGISATEVYAITIGCTGGIPALRFQIRDNQLTDGSGVAVLGATYAANGSALELRIPDVRAALADLATCDLAISLNAFADLDGMGSDFTAPCPLPWTTVGVEDPTRSSLELYRPSPNPFSETTTIAYAVGSQSGESVQIGIYDVAGRQVRELVNGFQAPGRYQASWDGRNNDGVSVTKGVYFLRAYVGGVRMANAARILYVR